MRQRRPDSHQRGRKARSPVSPPSTGSISRRCVGITSYPPPVPTSFGGSAGGRRLPPSKALNLADNAREQTFLAGRLVACEASVTEG